MATINHNDWNTVQSQIASVLGDPSATVSDVLGYHSAITSAQVATNQEIYGAEWNTLRADINSAYTHQTGSASDLTARGTTDIISAADLTLIAARSQTAYNNRLAVNGGQLAYQAGPSYSSGATWGVRTYFSGTIQFGSNAAFRGFWNGGGYLTFTASRSGGSGTNQNGAWSNLLSRMGTIVLTRTSMYQSGNSWGGTFYNSIGANGVYGSNIGSGLTQAFDITDTTDSGYVNALIYRIYLALDNASLSSATALTFEINCYDNHTAIASGPDYVNGTLALSNGIYYPFSNSATGIPSNYSGQS